MKIKAVVETAIYVDDFQATEPSTGRSWASRSSARSRANGIFFLKGWVCFCRPDGSTAGEAGAPSVLVNYDHRSTRHNHNALKRCKLAGQFLTIK